MSFIYKITNTVNNKIYIGKTVYPSPTKRLLLHFSQAKRGSNTYLHKAMRKYGIENFIISTLEEPDILLLNIREIYWIAELNSIVPFGYNCTKGGNGGDTSLSENYKQGIKNRPSTKGPLNPNFGKLGTNSPNFGKTRTEQQKNNLREGWLKSWKNPDRRKQASARQTILNNSGTRKKPYTSITIKFDNKIYYSLADAARDTGKATSYIKKHGEIINESKCPN